MQIQGSSSVHGVHGINSPHRASRPQPTQPSQPVQQADQLDISHEAELASQLHDVPEIRADRVAELRAQIQAGTYETPEKLDVALDRLLDELA